MTFYARTAGEPEALMGRVHAIVRGVDPDLPVSELKTMRAQVQESLFVERMVAALSAAFGVLATLLAALKAAGPEPFDLLVMDLSYARDTTSGHEGLELVDRVRAVAPALLMASADATLRDLMAGEAAPREVCRRLDQALAPRLAPDRFVSLAYAVLDRVRGALTYSNAGHPPPVLLHADGTVRPLDRGGPVLGMLADVDHEEAAAPLRPGDRLVLYTDSVIEASGKAGELGEERLLAGLRGLRGLSAPEAARAVLEMAVRFADGGPLQDDATVVVVDVPA